LNSNANGIRGILRYEVVTDPTSDPTTTAQSDIPNSCYDQSLSSLVPYLSKSVGPAVSEESLGISWYYDIPGGFIYHWTINSQALEIDWAQPTLKLISSGKSVFPTSYNIKDISAIDQVGVPACPQV